MLTNVHNFTFHTDPQPDYTTVTGLRALHERAYFEFTDGLHRVRPGGYLVLVFSKPTCLLYQTTDALSDSARPFTYVARLCGAADGYMTVYFCESNCGHRRASYCFAPDFFPEPDPLLAIHPFTFKYPGGLTLAHFTSSGPI